MALTTVVIRDFWVAYPYFFLIMGLVAMRIGPFSALLTALVSEKQRGILLSLTVALGQVGFAVGGGGSGLLYAGGGYASTTLLAGASVLGMGLLVWFLVPEPALRRRVSEPEAPDATPPPDGALGLAGGPEGRME